MAKPASDCQWTFSCCFYLPNRAGEYHSHWMHSHIDLVEPTSSSELEEYFRFRWQLLRAPWGQPLGSERDDFEESAHHLFARIESGELVGVGRVHFPDAETAQIRFMATKEQFRRLGIGKAILKRLEQVAKARGALVVRLDAREPAVSFYTRLGYSVCGDGHTLFGAIKHKKMQKPLSGARVPN